MFYLLINYILYNSLKSTMATPECFLPSTPKRAKFMNGASFTRKPVRDDTPRKTFLKKVLANTTIMYKTKIRKLQQQLRRREARIASMQTVLAALKKKNLLDDQQFHLLENFSTFNQHLLKRQIGMNKRLPKCRKYSPELRSCALTLHYYSPRAYKFV